LEILTDLFNKIYKTGYIPNDIHNYTKETKSTDFRKIILMSHFMKALLKIILDHNEKTLEAEISEN